MTNYEVKKVQSVIERRIELSDDKTLVIVAPLGWGVFQDGELRFDGKQFDVFKTKKAATLQRDFLTEAI